MPPITKRRASKKKTFRRNKSAKRSGSRSRPTGKTRTRNRTNRKIRLQRKKRRSMTKKRGGGLFSNFSNAKRIQDFNDHLNNTSDSDLKVMYELYKSKRDELSFLRNHFGSNNPNPIDSLKIGDSFIKLLDNCGDDTCSMGIMDNAIHTDFGDGNIVTNKEFAIKTALKMRRIAAGIPYSTLGSVHRSGMALKNKDKYKMVQHTDDRGITKLYLYNAVAGTLYKNSEKGIAEQIIKSCHEKAYSTKELDKVDKGLGKIGGEGLAKTLLLAHYIASPEIKIDTKKYNKDPKENNK